MVLDVRRRAPKVAVALVRAIQAVTARPLFVLAAQHDAETGPGVEGGGANDFLGLPVMAPELRALLQALLHRCLGALLMSSHVHMILMDFPWTRRSIDRRYRR